MEYAIAKISTKGQIVIPAFLRKGMNKGDEFLMVKDEGKIILKDIGSLASDLKDEFVFAQRVEKAWSKYENGKFKSKTKSSFIKELEKC